MGMHSVLARLSDEVCKLLIQIHWFYQTFILIRIQSVNKSVLQGSRNIVLLTRTNIFRLMYWPTLGMVIWLREFSKCKQIQGNSK